MSSLLLVLVVVLVLAGLIFGVIALLSGEDQGLGPVEPDGRALPLPANRSLAEADLKGVKFDTAVRGYRMTQVDRALRRTAYDIGYKDEMIAVLEAEVIALREGRTEDADLLRKAREAASDTTPAAGYAPPGRSSADHTRASQDGADARHAGRPGAGGRPGRGRQQADLEPEADLEPATAADDDARVRQVAPTDESGPTDEAGPTDESGPD